MVSIRSVKSSNEWKVACKFHTKFKRPCLWEKINAVERSHQCLSSAQIKCKDRVEYMKRKERMLCHEERKKSASESNELCFLILFDLTFAFNP